MVQLINEESPIQWKKTINLAENNTNVHNTQIFKLVLFSSKCSTDPELLFAETDQDVLKSEQKQTTQVAHQL